MAAERERERERETERDIPRSYGDFGSVIVLWVRDLDKMATCKRKKKKMLHYQSVSHVQINLAKKINDA